MNQLTITPFPTAYLFIGHRKFGGMPFFYVRKPGVAYTAMGYVRICRSYSHSRHYSLGRIPAQRSGCTIRTMSFLCTQNTPRSWSSSLQLPFAPYQRRTGADQCSNNRCRTTRNQDPRPVTFTIESLTCVIEKQG